MILKELRDELLSGGVRYSELLDVAETEKFLAARLTAIRDHAKSEDTKRMPRANVFGLRIWDLAAFVELIEPDRVDIGVSLGALRLFDFVAACVWSLEPCIRNTPEAPEAAQEYVRRVLEDDRLPARKLGTMLYYYTVGRFSDVRSFFLDISVGRLLTFGVGEFAMQGRFMERVPKVVDEEVHRRNYGIISSRDWKEIPIDRWKSQRRTLEVLATFVVAHELSHVLSGHCSNAGDHQIKPMGQVAVGSVKTSHIAHNQEQQADLEALRLLLCIYETGDVFRDVGLLFFTLSAIESISSHPVFWGHSHPPPFRRWAWLVSNCEKVTAGSTNDRERRAALEFAATTERFFDGLCFHIINACPMFRARPVLLSADLSYSEVENWEDTKAISEAAQLNNLADDLRSGGDVSCANAKYLDAIGILRQHAYGEGVRIVYTNAITTSFLIRNVDLALRLTAEGIQYTLDHNDLPSALELMKTVGSILANRHTADAGIIRRAKACLAKVKEPRLLHVIERLFAHLEKRVADG